MQNRNKIKAKCKFTISLVLQSYTTMSVVNKFNTMTRQLAFIRKKVLKY